MSGINGDVAIDNIGIQNGRCVNTLEESMECDFEDKDECKGNINIKTKGFKISNGDEPSKCPLLLRV